MVSKVGQRPPRYNIPNFSIKHAWLKFDSCSSRMEADKPWSQIREALDRLQATKFENSHRFILLSSPFFAPQDHFF